MTWTCDLARICCTASAPCGACTSSRRVKRTEDQAWARRFSVAFSAELPVRAAAESFHVFEARHVHRRVYYHVVQLASRVLPVFAALALAGCLVRPVDTQVRRVDSLGGVDRLGDELGAQGWRIVTIEALDGGGAYVVVLQREVAP